MNSRSRTTSVFVDRKASHQPEGYVFLWREAIGPEYIPSFLTSATRPGFRHFGRAVKLDGEAVSRNTAYQEDEIVRSFCGVVWATVPTKVDALPYLDLVAPSQKWRKSSLELRSMIADW